MPPISKFKSNNCLISAIAVLTFGKLIYTWKACFILSTLVYCRTLYYTYNIIIPCVMLSILTLLCIWMKPDSGEKISLGLTILLAFSVFMLLIAEDMPSTSVNVPIIGKSKNKHVGACEIVAMHVIL